MKRSKKVEMCIDELVEEILLPMSNVVMREEKNKISIFKDNFMFGYLQDDELYLADNNDEFKKVEKKIFTNTDLLLQQATKSFWIVAKKIS